MLLNTYKRVLREYKNFLGTRKFFGTIALWIFLSIILVLEPFIFTKILGLIEVFYKENNFDFYTLLWYGVFWGVFIIISLLLSYFYQYFIVSAPLIDYYTELLIKYGEKVLWLDYKSYLSQKQGKIIKRFDNGIQNLYFLILEFYNQFIKVFAGIILALIILFSIDIWMFFAVVAMLPFLFLVSYKTGIKTSTLQKETDEEYTKIFSELNDAVTNISLMKTLTLEKRFLTKLKKDVRQTRKKQSFVDRWWAISMISTGMFIMIERLIVIGYWVYRISEGTLSLAHFLLFFTFIGWIYFPLSALFERLSRTQRELVSINKMYEQFDNFSYEEKKEKWKKIEKTIQEIKFRDFSFSYNDEKKVIDSINLTIKSWQKIAFVGNTWAGKSTLVAALLRFWDYDDGQIFLDGTDINNFSKVSLRKHIGLVMQENSLFNMTIRENLLLAKKEATNKELIKALKKAKADFVFATKDGLDTLIGERGLKLSGGEKQRLSIARLFLKNPEILILDEATSALDNKTEKAVQASLDAIMAWRTSIIIAHRLSTIKHADIIYMLEDGKIVDVWTYDELIAKKWKFYELANPEKLILN